MSGPPLKDPPVIARVRDWTFRQALPFWAENAADRRYGGFIEEFALNGRDAALPEKRLRVSCRQIYAFSHAVLLGDQDGKNHIANGVEFLVGKGWQGPDKGFARRLARDGAVADPTPDLYDHAFALFAFAWAFRATKERGYLDWAHKTLDFVETHMAHESGEGFAHQLPMTGPRIQNPHMHLLEASLAAYEASGQARFGERAHDIAALFSRRFFDPETGTLGEYFDDNWRRVAGDKGRVCEPGHQFEWAWILDNCGRLLGLEFPEEIRALTGFGEKRGIDPKSRAVYMAVRDDGAALDKSSRVWANTERLKAAVALYEREGDDPSRIFEESAGLLLDRYFTPTKSHPIPTGAWIDAFDGDGRPVSATIPASTLYHVLLAFAEMLRVAGKISE
ncbi:MAG: AGE family epimerase/isomerase [Amphiplicatus sp.]